LRTFGSVGPAAGDAGRSRLERALWRAKAGILALAVGAGLVTLIALPSRGPLSLLVGLGLAFLAIVYFVARDLIGTPREVETSVGQVRRTSFLPTHRFRPKQEPVAARLQPSAQSAAGFLERFRESLALAESEAEEAARDLGRGGFTGGRRSGNTARENAGLRGGNELRYYLNKRLAAPVSGASRTGIVSKSTADATVLKSRDAVLDHVQAAARSSAPRTILVGGASAMVDAAAEAISIARALVTASDQAVLLDLAHGPRSVSGALGLPRSPGLTDLSAGRAQFEDIIRIDAETPLQLIAAGSPRFAASAEENARLIAIFEALTATYDSVVIHADRDALRRFAPALRFELPVVVAVLPARNGGAGTTDLGDFSALGCHVIAYEQSGKESRPRFGWAAAV
jgi:Mrp family chromosome partitioning ATPase